MIIITKEQLKVQLETLGYDILKIDKNDETYPQFDHHGLAIVNQKDLNWKPQNQLPIRVFIDTEVPFQLTQLGKPMGAMAFWYCYEYAQTPIKNR